MLMASRDWDCLDWQELREPTIQVENVISGTRRRAAYRQRRADHRLLDSLTESQKSAWADIARVWHHITFGMTAKAQGYERVDPSHGSGGEIGHKLTKQYSRWRLRVPACERSAIIAIICDGDSPFKASRERKRASSWGRYVLGKGLDKWDEVGRGI